MTSDPAETQNESDGAPEKPAGPQKDKEESAAALAPDTSGATGTGEDGSLQPTDGKLTANSSDGTTKIETTTANRSNETSNPKATENPKPKPIKIKVHLVAVGSAPILKKSKFLMNADDRFAVAIAFLRKVLKLSSTGTSSTGASVAASSLFLYVNAAFVPSPDERIGDLFDCFGTRGELVVHYSLQEAWG